MSGRTTTLVAQAAVDGTRGDRLRALLDAAHDVARGSGDRRLQDLAHDVMAAARAAGMEV